MSAGGRQDGAAAMRRMERAIAAAGPPPAPGLPRDESSTPAKIRRFAHGSRVPGWDTPADLDKDPSSIPDPATTPVPADLRASIEDAMARYPERRSAVIPALHAAQDLHGWCSPEAIEQVACVMRVTPGYVTAVATFYDMFKNEPGGVHDVYVCTNISCQLRGAAKLHEAIAAAAGEDARIAVRPFECLGACDIAPMASVDGVYVGPLEPADAEQLIDDLRAGRPVLEAKQLRHRASVDPGAAAGRRAAAGSPAGSAPGSAAPGSPSAGRAATDDDEERR